MKSKFAAVMLAAMIASTTMSGCGNKKSTLQSVSETQAAATTVEAVTATTEEAASAETAKPAEKTMDNKNVAYKNLVPRKTYKVYGRLISKATGKEATVGGKALTAESKPFTPEKADGSIDIELQVMFEKLYKTIRNKGKEVLIGGYEGLKDKAQTVTTPKAPKKSSGGHGGHVQTGEFPVLPLAGAGAPAALAAGAYLLKARKKEEDQ